MTYDEINDDKERFLAEYNIDEKEIDQCKTCWKTLLEIAKDFELHKYEFKRMNQGWIEVFDSFSNVHSIRSRVKDTGSLLKKIILISNKEEIKITPSNYITRVTDLMGIRLITIFKDDIVELHRQFYNEPKISSHITEVTYKFRSGDDKNIVDDLNKIHKVVVEENKSYRSLHYLLSNSSSNVKTEIQIRTIFEEGWSEIDHELVYKHISNPLLSKTSLILSDMIGSCNELGELMKQIDSSIRNENSNSEIIDDVMKKFLTL